ncbi:MAG: ATP-binding protein [Magnetococcus sp. MYC-9]
MIQGYSIRHRLTLTITLSLTIMLLLFWGVVSRAIQELTANYLETRMDLEISSILAELSLDDTDTIGLDDKRVDALFHFAFSGYYYQITLQGQGAPQLLRSPSLGSFTLTLPSLPTGNKARIFTKGPRDENLLTLLRSIPLREKKLTVAVAEDLTPIEKSINDFQLLYSMISLAFLLLLGLIHVIAVHRAMRPLQQIQHDVAQLEMGQISRLRDDVPEELKRVVGQINRLLLRMEQRLVRSRSIITNLSHAMKTPIATLTQLIQHPALDAEVGVRADLDNRLLLLNELIEQQLRRARLADQPLSGALFCPEHSLGALIRTLKNINFQKNVDVELDVSPGLSLPFDHEEMMEMLGNLLDNAFKWARTKISVTFEELAMHTHIWVEDDGPGVKPEEMEYLTQRGVRCDETTPGHGLGLAIVREIVDHYSGSMQFGRSSTLGGFRVQLTLPTPHRMGGRDFY